MLADDSPPARATQLAIVNGMNTRRGLPRWSKAFERISGELARLQSGMMAIGARKRVRERGLQ